MIWIEVLGPSGVGKSYWYAHFMKKYPNYEPQKLLLQRIFEKRKALNFPFKIKLFFFLYKLRLPKISSFFKYYLVDYFLSNHSLPKELYEKDNVIADKYLKHVKLYSEPEISILSKINYFAFKLNEFRTYEHYLNKDDVYIAEDGLLHLSAVYFDELQPDFAIVLEKNKEVILEQRKKRAETNPRLIEKLLHGNHLDNYIDNYFQLYEKKLAALDNEKVLLIQTENDLSIEKAYTAIKSRAKKNGQSSN